MVAPQLRTVEVVPPSRSGEDYAVSMACAGVVLAALYFIAATRPAPDSRAAATLPFQVRFQDLPSSEQRSVRALLEGFGEARNLRVRSGEWPRPDQLAAEQIPPFAEDALDRARYRWTLERAGTLIKYRGLPEAPGSPLLLLLIQEPEPVGAEIAQPGVVDEEHQLLPDGRLLHVTYWKRTGPAPPGVVSRPEIEGWQQIRMGTTENEK